jgi:hypothetical protein
MERTDDANFQASLELLNDAIASVNALTPKGCRDLPGLEVVALRMFWQSFSKCRAIHLLVSNGCIGEAAIALRSLMFDCHHLLYLKNHPAERDGLLLSLREREIRNMQRVARVASKAGMAKDIGRILEKTEEDLRELERERIELGAKEDTKFPNQGAKMARKLGRLSDVVGYEMFSSIVHGAALGPVRIGLRKIKDREVNLELADKNPKLAYGAAYDAIEFLFEASIAVATWEEWDTLEELEGKYKAIDVGFRELGEARGWIGE